MITERCLRFGGQAIEPGTIFAWASSFAVFSHSFLCLQLIHVLCVRCCCFSLSFPLLLMFLLQSCISSTSTATSSTTATMTTTKPPVLSYLLPVLLLLLLCHDYYYYYYYCYCYCYCYYYYCTVTTTTTVSNDQTSCMTCRCSSGLRDGRTTVFASLMGLGCAVQGSFKRSLVCTSGHVMTCCNQGY